MLRGSITSQTRTFSCNREVYYSQTGGQFFWKFLAATLSGAGCPLRPVRSPRSFPAPTRSAWGWAPGRAASTRSWTLPNSRRWRRASLWTISAGWCHIWPTGRPCTCGWAARSSAPSLNAVQQVARQQSVLMPMLDAFFCWSFCMNNWTKSVLSDLPNLLFLLFLSFDV